MTTPTLIQNVKTYAEYGVIVTGDDQSPKFKEAKELYAKFQGAKKVHSLNFFTFVCNHTQEETGALRQKLTAHAATKAGNWSEKITKMSDEKKAKYVGKANAESDVLPKATAFDQARDTLRENADWKVYRKARREILQETIPLVRAGVDFEVISQGLAKEKVSPQVIQEVKDLTEKFKDDKRYAEKQVSPEVIQTPDLPEEFKDDPRD